MFNVNVNVVPVAVPSVKVMNVYDETSSSLRVKWEDVEEATGYMLLYRPVSDPQLLKEVGLRS